MEAPVREIGESLKAFNRRKGEWMRRQRAETARQERLYRQARRVYNEEDRSPDSDPYDVERPSF